MKTKEDVYKEIIRDLEMGGKVLVSDITKKLIKALVDVTPLNELLLPERINTNK